MTEHKHAWVLRAIADGEPLSNFEGRHDSWLSGEFADLEDEVSISHLLKHPDAWGVRRKRKTMTLNGYTFAEPVREPLKKRQKYWAVTSAAVVKSLWDNDDVDLWRLERGLIQVEEADAIAQHKAMLAPFKRD